MGRPIKKIFIGERGAGNAGGESLADVTIGGTADSGIVDNDDLIISAPDIEGGVQAAGYVVSGAGDIDSVVITEPGNGYTSIPTVSVANISNRTLTGVLSSTNAGVINCEAFIPAVDGGTGIEAGDIIAQRASRTYRVTTTEGTGDCQLVDTVPVAGEMRIPALDSTGNSYWVTKLLNRTVLLTQNNEATTFEFASGVKVGWADVAVLDHSVKITS